MSSGRKEELEQNDSNIMKPWRNREICSHGDSAILNCICIFNIAYEAWLGFQKSQNWKLPLDQSGKIDFFIFYEKLTYHAFQSSYLSLYILS